MTDTAAREEAVERVRAYVREMGNRPDDWAVVSEIDDIGGYCGFYLGDLRLLLSGGEGGSVAIASREGRAVIANLATEELLALVLDGDHRRGCQGREYTCSCGYDTRVEREATTLRSALTDPRQPSEADFDIDAFIAGYVMAVEKRHKGPWEGIYDYAALVGQEWHQAGRKPVEVTEVATRRKGLATGPAKPVHQPSEPPVTADEGWDAELRDWTVEEWPSGRRVAGAIYGDRLGRFPDGERVVTSPVVAIKGETLVTRNSRYRLVTPAPPTGEGGGL